MGNLKPPSTEESIRRRMNWAWFLLAYCLFIVVATSVTMCFVTAILSFSDTDVFNELNPDNRLVEFCRTHETGVDCDGLAAKMRLEQAEDENPIWMIFVFYFMAIQVLGSGCFGLYASSGRLRDLRGELKASQFGHDGAQAETERLLWQGQPDVPTHHDGHHGGHHDGHHGGHHDGHHGGDHGGHHGGHDGGNDTGSHHH